MLYRITQCYLPPDRGDIPAFTPAEADTRKRTAFVSTDCPRSNATIKSSIAFQLGEYQAVGLLGPGQNTMTSRSTAGHLACGGPNPAHSDHTSLRPSSWHRHRHPVGRSMDSYILEASDGPSLAPAAWTEQEIPDWWEVWSVAQ